MMPLPSIWIWRALLEDAAEDRDGGR